MWASSRLHRSYIALIGCFWRMERGKQTFAQEGETVTDLTEREVVRAPREQPQVNLGSIELKKRSPTGYHSGPVLEQLNLSSVPVPLRASGSA